MRSNITSHFRFAIPAGIAGLLALLLMTFGSVKAQTVTGTQAIAFGSVNRGITATILYSDASSAQFSVTGRQGKTVRLSVSSASLSRNAYSFPITINTSDCYFSINNGTTWTVFSTGTLFHDVVIPNGVGNGNQGTILVKIGGSITPSATQSHGTYTGSVTLTAAYR